MNENGLNARYCLCGHAESEHAEVCEAPIHRTGHTYRKGSKYHPTPARPPGVCPCELFRPRTERRW